jgi:hypothetical protein
MHRLGKPITVCPQHIHQLDCPAGHCLGAECDERKELLSATHENCAICGGRPRFRPLRTLRKCSHLGCVGCFRPSSIDEMGISALVAGWKRRLKRKSAG